MTDTGKKLSDVPADWWRVACHLIKYPLACVGTDSRFIWVNTAYEELTGYPVTRLKELQWQDITILEDINDDLDSVNAVINGSVDSRCSVTDLTKVSRITPLSC